MFLSAKAFFEDNTQSNIRLLTRMETEIPEDFVRLYKKNVVNITPKKTGALRRSIITQVVGNQGNISWRAPYARAQNEGRHTVGEKRVVNIGGQYRTLMPGVYIYSNYTTEGTGPRFASTAFKATKAQMPANFRERRYIK